MGSNDPWGTANLGPRGMVGRTTKSKQFWMFIKQGTKPERDTKETEKGITISA